MEKMAVGSIVQLTTTPGPWRALRDEVWVGPSRRICPRVTAGESLPIGADLERAKANAKLIAAAPELLAFAQWFLENRDGPGRSMAQAAVDKAVGAA